MSMELKQAGLWLTIKDLAERWAVSSRSVRRLLDSGKLPTPLRIGKALRFSLRAIERFENDKTKGFGAA